MDFKCGQQLYQMAVVAEAFERPSFAPQLAFIVRVKLFEGKDVIRVINLEAN